MPLSPGSNSASPTKPNYFQNQKAEIDTLSLKLAQASPQITTLFHNLLETMTEPADKESHFQWSKVHEAQSQIMSYAIQMDLLQLASKNDMRLAVKYIQDHKSEMNQSIFDNFIKKLLTQKRYEEAIFIVKNGNRDNTRHSTKDSSSDHHQSLAEYDFLFEPNQFQIKFTFPEDQAFKLIVESQISDGNYSNAINTLLNVKDSLICKKLINLMISTQLKKNGPETALKTLKELQREALLSNRYENEYAQIALTQAEQNDTQAAFKTLANVSSPELADKVKVTIINTQLQQDKLEDALKTYNTFSLLHYKGQADYHLSKYYCTSGDSELALSHGKKMLGDEKNWDLHTQLVETCLFPMLVRQSKIQLAQSTAYSVMDLDAYDRMLTSLKNLN